jgi:cytochrome c-type biogenesis protein
MALLESFILGLLTPLGAVCVLPLYPGFIAYLANRNEERRASTIALGLLVTLGVLLFMFLLGLIFTTALKVSLTKVIGIISPIAFIILAVISIFLIFDINIGRFFPQAHAPVFESPYSSAFIYGFFFGAIVIPCNPLFIAALFTRAIVQTSFIVNMANFVSFGLGIAAPLLVLSILSSGKSNVLINFLIKYRRAINVIVGLFMLGVSLYYLIFVFRLFG